MSITTAFRRFLLGTVCFPFLSAPLAAATPDSMYLLAYPAFDNGLYFAWSTNATQWYEIGPKHRYVGSDYGPWGREKKMFDPYLIQAPDGMWHCVWSLNHYDNCFAHAASHDLIHWKRQSYPPVMKGLEGGNCLQPEVFYDEENKQFIISWLSNQNRKDTLIYYCTTRDFKDYGAAQISDSSIRRNDRHHVSGIGSGTLHRVSASCIETLQNAHYRSQVLNQLYAERTADDGQRFRQLSTVQAHLAIQPKESKVISDKLMGIFFEDINYAADGGLYAELIQNRGFEYNASIRNEWHALTAWDIVHQGASEHAISTEQPLHENNPHHIRLTNRETGECRLINNGFDFISLKAGESYLFSTFARLKEGKTCKLQLRLIDRNDQTIASGNLSFSGKEWKAYRTKLTAKSDCREARLEINYSQTGSIDLDMVSLFPQKTFKNRPNGLRADLAQTLADLHPKFVRFPGGCVAHGDGLHNMYRWKNTIGPLESRKGQRNIWGYYQSYGLGYYEYFQFCEDIGAEPLPILPAGVPCQNSAHGGQQGGIPLCEMDDYIQEVLDLIEWANGDANSEWGRKRAEAGHPKPFHLKYIGIGNEDLITDVFEERFTMIYQAVKERYPEIKVVGTVGPFYEGTDYEEGWALADKLGIDVVDEHYYNPPGWFIYNQHFYDRYDRSKKTKVYLGEYASHLPGRPNNLETALSEALYLTAVERNGDVVEMCSYAPLLAKHGHTQWNPNLIYFNNHEVFPTVGYYVQQLYGKHSGNRYIDSHLRMTTNDDKVKNRVGCSVVTDGTSGDLIIKMVNLLPTQVDLTIEVEASESWTSQASLIQMTGQPADKNIVPSTLPIQFKQQMHLQLPAYSFSIIRAKASSQK